MTQPFRIEIAPTGYESLEEIGNKKILEEVSKVIDGLEVDPGNQGKELMEPFVEVRSIGASRNRYRVLYKVNVPERLVSVLLVGKRRPGGDEDVYEVAKRLLKNLLKKGEE